MRNMLLRLCAVIVMCVSTSGAIGNQGRLAIIVHPGNPVTALSQADVMRLFLGKTRAFPNQTPASPVSLAAGNQIRSEFDTLILNKTTNQVRAYWAQQIFTGRGTPPRELGSEADILSHVAKHTDAVGYVSAGQVSSAVKPVLILD
jgi:hypothetical protein